MAIEAILLVLFGMDNIAAGDSRLRMVQTVFRHGDRAPSAPYPHDRYGIEYWPRGWSQLTNIGVKQTVELGEFLRRRYVHQYDFLSPTYKREQIYVRSSDKDRTILSAQCLLSGLFQSANGGTFEPSPPIHMSSPYTDDLLLKPNSVPCAEYDRLYEEESGQLLHSYNSYYARFFRFLSLQTGWTVNMSNIADVFSAVYREILHELPQPDWVHSVWDQHSGDTAFDLIVELKRVSRLEEFNSPKKSRLRAGFLLADIFNRMTAKTTRNDASTHDFVLYSSHDATVTALMYALGLGNDLLTPYAAALMFELWQDDQGKFAVKVLYRNDTSVPPYEMLVPGCSSSPCALQRLTGILQSQFLHTRAQHTEACGGGGLPVALVSRPQEEDINAVEKSSQVVEKISKSRDFLTVACIILSLVSLIQATLLFRLRPQKGSDKTWSRMT